MVPLLQMEEILFKIRKADLQMSTVMYLPRLKCRMISSFGPIPWQTITVVFYMDLFLFLLTTGGKKKNKHHVKILKS